MKMKNTIKSPVLQNVKSIHLIGIGGSGMNGIAELLLNKGYRITGSDSNPSHITERLKKLGALIFHNHDSMNVLNSDIVVSSSAIDKDNPELLEANKLNLPILGRAQMLAEIMKFYYGIAIAGTHGKTTTSGLLASILVKAGIDPTFVIGGIINDFNISSNVGNSKFFIFEADESDASFLYFNPIVSIITNINKDHMQTYNNDLDFLKQAFINFVHKLPIHGLAIMCYDDYIVREIIPNILRSTITYGFDEYSDVQIVDFYQFGLNCSFKIYWKSLKQYININLNLPGKHNALNATAAIIAAVECCQVNIKSIISSLSEFKGINRRIQYHGEIMITPGNLVTMIDDYGHHPTEILSTLNAIRAAYPKRRIILIFQPHRYTRTQDLFEDFVNVLSTVDILLLMDIYAANEQPILGIDSKTLIQAIILKRTIIPIFVPDCNTLMSILPQIINNQDVLLIQGAGDIGLIPSLLKREFNICTTQL